MFTVFKNVTILATALAERQIFGTPISPLMWLSFALIISSSLIGAANDLTFSLRGYIWMFVNCIINASYGICMRLCIQRVQFADFDSVFYNNVLAIPIMAVLSLATENWSEFFQD